MCLAQGPQRSDAGEARTRGPSVSSQALCHCAPTFKIGQIPSKNILMAIVLGTLYSIQLSRVLTFYSLPQRHCIRFSAELFPIIQAFRFMVGPGHCPMISKYGPSLSKTVGPVDPSFLVVKKSHFNKNNHLPASLCTPQNRNYMWVVNTIKCALSSHSKRQKKDLNNKW